MGYHDTSVDSVLAVTGGRMKGLDSDDAARRLERDGKNELRTVSTRSPLAIIASQFNDFLIWILIGAVFMSIIVGEHIDAAVIGIILILNALLGFFQEFRAEKAIEKLKHLTAPKSTVLRDGKPIEIPSSDVVVGDILIVSEGTKISADCRLVDAGTLEVNESSLTGESLPVVKACATLKHNLGIGDRTNMIYAGTTVTKGHAKAVVVSTAMETEFGKIAGLISETTRVETPLKTSLTIFGRKLGFGVLGICAVVFSVGYLRGNDPILMFLAAISLAVAAVPEGLPAVVTITLSLGVQKMASRNALIRHLPAVETLGSTTVICSDKTGTLTHNQMTVTHTYIDGQIIKVSGEGYAPEGSFEKKSPGLKTLLTIGLLCNDATLSKNGSSYEAFGDPTEAALITSAAKLGLDHDTLSQDHPRSSDIPFSSERKLMSVTCKTSKKLVMYTKGSAEPLLDRCTKILHQGKIITLTKAHRKDILNTQEEFASQALRVLGFAYKPVTSDKSTEEDLIFVGLQAMIDPPRQDAIDAIAQCKEAGIRVVMITGDHKTTAIAIAKRMGIGDRAVTGTELADLDLDTHIDKIDIYARVAPEHKLRIVESFQKKGEVVAMTGDGVNDAPALKKSDIGVAMGITGTDVSKEAAEMVLADDNFATLVAAVKEGRVIYDNIRKFVEFLLSCNLGEVLVIFVAILLGLPLPLVAAMILWMNLMTDGFPALALGVSPAEKDVMSLEPRKKDASLLSNHMLYRLLFIGFLMCTGTLGLFWYELSSGSLNHAQTIAFCTLVFFQLWNVLNYSSMKSIFKVGVSNRLLIVAISSSILFQIIVVYLLNPFFGTVPLDLSDWGMILAVSSVAFILAELLKTASFWTQRTKAL